MPILSALAHESVAVSTTAVGLTATAQDGYPPTAAIITVEGADIRYCFDGTTATTTVGHIASNGDVITLVNRDQINRFSAISKDGASATLKVTHGLDYVA